MVKVETLQVGEYGMNCYLVVNGDALVIVDPGADAEGIAAAIDDRRPEAVLLTHGHYDHIGAVDALCERYHIPLYLHPADWPKLMDADANVGRQFDRETFVSTTPLPVTDGQKLRLAGMEITVLHTPGHSAGGVCYLLPENAGLLCGDTLFNGGYGRYDFPDGSFHELKESLKRLLFLHPRMVAYPGHGASTFAGRDE